VERQHQPQHERQVTHARQRLQTHTLREFRVSIFEQLPAKITVSKQDDLAQLSCQLLTKEDYGTKCGGKEKARERTSML
jgi:hypothetical protein